MKKSKCQYITVAICLLCLWHSRLAAQHLVVSADVEKNVAGLHYGTSLCFETRGSVLIGGFYQFGLQRMNEEVVPTRKYYGLHVQLPLASSERIGFHFQGRIGFVNKDFLVFIPGFCTTLRLSRALSVSVGSGFRMQHPTMTGKLNLTI